MFLDEIYEVLVCFGLGNVVSDAGLADVEIDLRGSATDVAEIRIGHLAGTIHDTAHDCDFDALKVTGFFAYALCRGLQVEERSAAAWTSDELGFRNSGSCSLKNIVSELGRSGQVIIGLDANEISDPVAEQASG